MCRQRAKIQTMTRMGTMGTKVTRRMTRKRQKMLLTVMTRTFRGRHPRKNILASIRGMNGEVSGM